MKGCCSEFQKSKNFSTKGIDDDQYIDKLKENVIAQEKRFKELKPIFESQEFCTADTMFGWLWLWPSRTEKELKYMINLVKRAKEKSYSILSGVNKNDTFE